MVSFENFVKSMLPSSSELKVTPNFCFPFKIPDDLTATIMYVHNLNVNCQLYMCRKNAISDVHPQVTEIMQKGKKKSHILSWLCHTL